MAYSLLLRIVLIFSAIAIELRHTLCDERVQIRFRNHHELPEVHSEFSYEDQVITDEQIKLFQLDGNKIIDAWLKYQVAPPPGRLDRPSCVVAKGPCNGQDYFVLKNLNETKVHVTIADKGIVRTIDGSKEPNKVRWLSQIYTNNSTEKVRWRPGNKFTLTTPVTRTHCEETTNAWWLEAAGTSFLNVVTPTGSFQLESKWCENSIETKSFQVIEVRSVSEVEVAPGESVRSYVTYKERRYALKLTYNMTILYDSGGYLIAGYSNDTLHVHTNSILPFTEGRYPYSHGIQLEFTVPYDIYQTIEKFKGVEVQRYENESYY